MIDTSPEALAKMRERCDIGYGANTQETLALIDALEEAREGERAWQERSQRWEDSYSRSVGFEVKAAEADAERERIAKWMIKNSLATGHGDTVDDLLNEVAGHIAEMRDALRIVETGDLGQALDAARTALKAAP